MAYRVTLIEGDGVGPEVTGSAIDIMRAMQLPIEWDRQIAGKKAFEAGISSGVTPEAVASIKDNKVVLKGPLETPVGFGEKSANVTLRKLFETFGNIRPAKSIPGVPTPFTNQKIDMVIVRENVEDLYTGIEHMLTPHVAQCLKVITRLGCEKIVRLAFELARAEGRKKVSCATKANIMKLTEGLLKRVFEEIAPEFPDIKAEHIIVDNCAHQMVINPSQFDVIVATNLNGDILSDLASGLVGGLGFAPSANVGNQVSMFEAVHGSAPTIAGKNMVNPTSLILSAVMMLRHLGELKAAAQIEAAVYKTLAGGICTADAATASQKAVSTTEFTAAVIHNLSAGGVARSRDHKVLDLTKCEAKTIRDKVYGDGGVDITLHVAHDVNIQEMADFLKDVSKGTGYRFQNISNRGMQIYPVPDSMPDLVNSWGCRFVRDNDEKDNLYPLMEAIARKYTVSAMTKLLMIEGKEGFSKSQGE